ncbi:hypothetical protein EG329_009901 [Mollisiaceae sp. DMI_Dod_QoI]|nr:hypothetical protein EG329_009901 [Helotiales sp. DMI_Dod_QoI]
MSTRPDRNRYGGSARSENKYEWSDWVWNSRKGKYYRSRINSKGKKVYESPPPTPESTTPRSFVPPISSHEYTRFASSSSADTGSQDYNEDEEIEYQEDYQASGEPDQLSQAFAQASLVDRTDDASPSDVYYEDNTTGKGKDASYTAESYQTTQPIPITDRYGSSPVVDHNYSYFSESAQNYAEASESNLTSDTQGQYTEPSSNLFYNSQTRIYEDASTEFSASYASQTSQATITLATQPPPPTPIPPPMGLPNTISRGSITYKQIHRNIGGTKGKHEKLDPRFKVRHSDEFIPGYIFKVLWVEPKGTTAKANITSDATDATSDVWYGKHGEQVHSSIRRFVIIATDYGHSQCLPILTYRHQATTKWGVKREDHAIIYTGAKPPAPLPGESSLLESVQVTGKTPRDMLLPESRINYAKIYTVEHNVKVFFIGWIAEGSQRRVVTDFDAVWYNKLHISVD